MSDELTALPWDLLARVCSFLDARSLCQVALTSQQAAEVSCWAPLLLFTRRQISTHNRKRSKLGESRDDSFARVVFGQPFEGQIREDHGG